MKKTTIFLLALGFGALITYVDSSPNWDDSGISAMAVLLTCGVFAFIMPRQWWLWALAVGVWIPLVGIVRTQNYGAILALVVAFVGALVGMGLRVGISGKPALP